VDGDTHKIIGFSDNWHHHIDSIRLGWRYDPVLNKIQIMTILYYGGERIIRHLCLLDVNTDLTYKFIISKNKTCYFVNFDKSTDILPRKSRWFGPRYLLFPYFGGQKKSEKKITFKIIR